jgi:hypothetical protein
MSFAELISSSWRNPHKGAEAWGSGGKRAPTQFDSRGNRRNPADVAARKQSANKSGLVQGSSGMGASYSGFGRSKETLSQYNTRSDWWNVPALQSDAGMQGGVQRWNKYVGGAGQAEKGWMNTLQQTTGSNKGQTGTPSFSTEVFSTRETRAKASGAGTWLTSFQALPQHSDRSQLDPSFLQMYGEVDKLKGAVRRSNARLL